MQTKPCSYLACAAQFELSLAAPLFDCGKHLQDGSTGVDRWGIALMAAGAAMPMVS